MEVLYENILMLDWKQVVMWIIGGILIFLAIKKQIACATVVSAHVSG